MLIEEMIQLIDGWEDVVQAGTDNAANFKAAGMILLEKKPHIVCVQCAAHCADRSIFPATTFLAEPIIGIVTAVLPGVCELPTLFYKGLPVDRQ